MKKYSITVCVVCLLTLSLIAVAAESNISKALKQKITIDVKGMALDEAFDAVAEKAGITISLSKKTKKLIMDGDLKADQDFENEIVKDILDTLSMDSDIWFKVKKDALNIVIGDEIKPPSPPRRRSRC